MDLNFEGVEQFSILPDGPHRLVIEDYEETQVKSGDNKGAPMMVITLKSMEYGISFKQWLPAVPKALWKIQQLLEAATGKPWKTNGMRVDGQVLLGRSVGAMVSSDVYNNNKNNKVDTYMPADELPAPGEFVNAPADFLDQGYSPDPGVTSVPSNLPDDNFDF